MIVLLRFNFKYPYFKTILLCSVYLDTWSHSSLLRICKARNNTATKYQHRVSRSWLYGITYTTFDVQSIIHIESFYLVFPYMVAVLQMLMATGMAASCKLPTINIYKMFAWRETVWSCLPRPDTNAKRSIARENIFCGIAVTAIIYRITQIKIIHSRF